MGQNDREPYRKWDRPVHFRDTYGLVAGEAVSRSATL